MCQCYAFELLCLTRDEDEHTLESVSYKFAESCDITQCLCNTSTGWTRWSAPANDGQPLPEPLLVELPSYQELESVAKSEAQDAQAVYYRSLYSEITSQSDTRKDTVVNHQINDGKPEYLPAVIMNKSVQSMVNYCDNSITCDLHYEMDWDLKLTREVTCSETELVDICFATNACICSNEYYRISLDMPKLSKNYQGQVDRELLAAFEDKINVPEPDKKDPEKPEKTQKEGKNTDVTNNTEVESEESDDDDDTMLILIICGSVLGAVILFTGCYFMYSAY